MEKNTNKIILKQIDYIPGLYNLFEITIIDYVRILLTAALQTLGQMTRRSKYEKNRS